MLVDGVSLADASPSIVTPFILIFGPFTWKTVKPRTMAMTARIKNMAAARPQQRTYFAWLGFMGRESSSKSWLRTPYLVDGAKGFTCSLGLGLKRSMATIMRALSCARLEIYNWIGVLVSFLGR